MGVADKDLPALLTNLLIEVVQCDEGAGCGSSTIESEDPRAAMRCPFILLLPVALMRRRVPSQALKPRRRRPYDACRHEMAGVLADLKCRGLWEEDRWPWTVDELLAATAWDGPGAG
jgi:hypothetical protein